MTTVICSDCKEGVVVIKGLCRRCYDRKWRKKHPGYNTIQTRLWRKNNPERYKAMTKSWNMENKEKVKKYSRIWHKKYLTQKSFYIGYMNCTICGRHGRKKFNYHVYKETGEPYSSGVLYFEHRIYSQGKWKYDGMCKIKTLNNYKVKEMLRYNKKQQGGKNG